MTTEAISREEYHLKLLTKRFGNEYNISTIQASSTSTSNNVINEYILKPKNNPSLLQATLFPMYKTRYKYKVTFSSPTNNNTNNSGSDLVEYVDMYAISFNRTNGSTSTQQERIYKQTKAFEEQLDKLKVELQYDHDMKKQEEHR